MGVVFNIQRYSAHDGPGIRSIAFLKGCALRCPWCSNPEGIAAGPQLAVNADFCKGCGKCAAACPRAALKPGVRGIVEHRAEECDYCGKCENYCDRAVLKIFGKEYTADELLKEIAKDMAFFRRSGGGITLSGGDPLYQAGFAAEVLRLAKQEYGLSTAMESSFYANEAAFRSAAEHLDFAFCDIKLIDDRRHRDIMGVSNRPILRNIGIFCDEYVGCGRELIFRMPVIPHVNDDEENIRETARFIRSLPRGIPLELIPYHEYGRGKYPAIGKAYPMDTYAGAAPPGKDQVERLEKLFESYGVNVVRT